MSSRDPRAEHPLDEELSAFLDGELPPERHAALQREIESDPELAQRIAAFREADEALRALPTRPLPREMAASLRKAIDSGAPSMRAVRARREEEVIDLAVDRRRRVVVVAAAAAAALLLFFMSFGEPGNDYTVESGTQYVRVFEPESLTIEAPDPVPPGESEATATIAGGEAEVMAEPLPAIFDEVADEDLALAVEFETLEDLEVIRDLDLLEVLARLDNGGAG
jgi:hypothetical protein